MAKPEIPMKKPIVLELESGTYWWCTCGRSKKQPFCDGSHQGTEFTPMQWEVKEKKKYAVCACKYTKTPPLCDGSHKNL